MLGNEDGIEIFWGLKSDFCDALHFWIAAFRADMQNCYDFEVKSANSYSELLQALPLELQKELERGTFTCCQVLAPHSYTDLLTSFCPNELIEHFSLTDFQSFVGAMQMADEWNYKVIVAEFKERFFYIVWATGG
ncbi:hypothetical protein IQ268_26765 [Oculatella sp. LEGE 06141]|uniref:hypothetical protein n=1 Tax=Oculatella sp. LEGE 06141 TaxID=1828648 RepID=UPI001881972C|nr:hypothetical protein [Oculatella sp. LEGE 06141]MBE9182173.1 hypothetical protein [Oculatella sp. LEGE 06141]